MEKSFKALFDQDENDSFIKFSQSMKDMASIFKIDKKERSLDAMGKMELLKKKNFKKNQL